MLLQEPGPFVHTIVVKVLGHRGQCVEVAVPACCSAVGLWSHVIDALRLHGHPPRDLPFDVVLSMSPGMPADYRDNEREGLRVPCDGNMWPVLRKTATLGDDFFGALAATPAKGYRCLIAEVIPSVDSEMGRFEDVTALAAALEDACGQRAAGPAWECAAQPCRGRRFVQVWSTARETYTALQLRSAESIVRHHADACVCVYAEALPEWWFAELWYYGHNVRVARTDTRALCERLPAAAAAWGLRADEWRRSSRHFYAHWADWLRLALLYVYGGTYADTDMIFVRELGTDGEPATNTTCADLGGIAGVPHPWPALDPPVVMRHTGHRSRAQNVSLNNALLSFDRGNKFAALVLAYIGAHYDPRCWGCQGPRALTRAYEEHREAIEGRWDADLSCTPSRVGRFQPTRWQNAGHYLHSAEDELFAEVARSSTAVHLWNKAAAVAKFKNGSFAAQASMS
eukprot:m51a1_g14773 putative lactosylceramide 4-alpha-galactosyltransferase (456) ;mRNA; r:415748-421845